MKALILGAGGQVGRALAASAPAGAEVLAYGRAQCDVADAAQVHAAVAAARPHIVFNAAAYTAVDKAEAEPEQAMLLNGSAAGVIAQATRAAGARMVHISTDFVFDGRSPNPYGIHEPTNPLGVYGRTKLAGEEAVFAADADALVVRTAWVYAPRGANFLNTMLRLIGERDEVRVVADQVGTPTYALSLAQALWALATAGASGLHHFTDAGVASWYDFAVAIAEEGQAAGLLRSPGRVVPIPTTAYPTPARRPAYSVLDKTDTWSLLDAPPPHWRVNLRAALQELRSHV